MFHSLLSQTTTGLMAAVCLWAIVGARWPERATGIAYACNWIGSALGEDRRPWHHGQPVILGLDAAFLVFMLLLTLACRRTWLLWMAACSLLVVLTHMSMLMDTSLRQWEYQTAYYIWSMGSLIAFAAGVLIEGRRPVHWLIRPA